MPTNFPPTRPAPAAKKRKSLFDIAFNTILVVSALMLTFVVLVREEQYALQVAPPVEQAMPGDALIAPVAFAPPD